MSISNTVLTNRPATATAHAPRTTPARPAATRPPAPPTPSTIADMSWWLVGAFTVAIVGLSVLITLLLRAATGPISLAWFISRGAGVAGYLLITGSMIYGLLITTKTANGTLPAPVSYGMHEFISWLGLAFIVAHTLVLLLDGYIGYTLPTLLIPFNSTVYRPIWVGFGQVAFYGSVLLSAAFYAKKYIKRAWRVIHYISFLMFLLGTIHGLLSGTDSKTLIMQIVYIASFSSVMFLTLLRIFMPRHTHKPG